MGFCFNHRKESSAIPNTKINKIPNKCGNKLILRKNVKPPTLKLSASDHIFLQSIGLALKPLYNHGIK